jgi:hypothetical protein
MGFKCNGGTQILYLSEYAFTESFESAKAVPSYKFCIASPDRFRLLSNSDSLRVISSSGVTFMRPSLLDRFLPSI